MDLLRRRSFGRTPAQEGRVAAFGGSSPPGATDHDHRTARRRQDSRPHHRADGAVRDADPRRPRRGGDQGRAARGRRHPPHRADAQSRHGAHLPARQPRQAERRARSQAAGGARRPAPPRAARRRDDLERPPGGDEAARPRLRRRRRAQPAHRVRHLLRLRPARAGGGEARVRRSHPGGRRHPVAHAAGRRAGARVRAGDARRPAHRAARGLCGVGRAVRARADRQGPGGRGADVRGRRAVRARRSPGRPHLRAADRRTGLRAAAHAAPPAVRNARRLPLPADLQRQAVAELLRRDRRAGALRARPALRVADRARRAHRRGVRLRRGGDAHAHDRRVGAAPGRRRHPAPADELAGRPPRRPAPARDRIHGRGASSDRGHPARARRAHVLVGNAARRARAGAAARRAHGRGAARGGLFGG